MCICFFEAKEYAAIDVVQRRYKELGFTSLFQFVNLTLKMHGGQENLDVCNGIHWKNSNIGILERQLTRRNTKFTKPPTPSYKALIGLWWNGYVVSFFFNYFICYNFFLLFIYLILRVLNIVQEENHVVKNQKN